MTSPLHIKNATIWDGNEPVQRDLFIKNGRIVAEKPNHALEVDLEGFTLFPGLVNAHDHLELNHFPRTKFREVYDNAHQWGEDVNARLNEEPFKTLRSYPLWDRVFIGGLKNLLCGATTVIHHGPPHKPMFRKDFPVRVLKKYGWAHSLHFNTEEEIIRSYKNTPKDVPWFIHLAEGTDEIAKGEYKKLKDMQCLDLNRTVIVHAVSWFEQQGLDDTILIKGFIWCPTTNIYLLNQTMPSKFIKYYPEINAIALGSDARLTANGDLLDELNFALSYLGETETNINYLMMMLFYDTPFIAYSISEKNRINTQQFADIIAIKNTEHPAKNLCLSSRKDLCIVIRNGIPQIGNPELMAKFPHIQTVACILDGVEKRMNVDLARQVHRCKLKVQGLEVDELPSGKRFIFF